MSEAAPPISPRVRHTVSIISKLQRAKAKTPRTQRSSRAPLYPAQQQQQQQQPPPPPVDNDLVTDSEERKASTGSVSGPTHPLQENQTSIVPSEHDAVDVQSTEAAEPRSSPNTAAVATTGAAEQSGAREIVGNTTSTPEAVQSSPSVAESQTFGARIESVVRVDNTAVTVSADRIADAQCGVSSHDSFKQDIMTSVASLLDDRMLQNVEDFLDHFKIVELTIENPGTAIPTTTDVTNKTSLETTLETEARVDFGPETMHDVHMFINVLQRTNKELAGELKNVVRAISTGSNVESPKLRPQTIAAITEFMYVVAEKHSRESASCGRLSQNEKSGGSNSVRSAFTHNGMPAPTVASHDLGSEVFSVIGHYIDAITGRGKETERLLECTERFEIESEAQESQNPPDKDVENDNDDDTNSILESLPPAVAAVVRALKEEAARERALHRDPPTLNSMSLDSDREDPPILEGARKVAEPEANPSKQVIVGFSEEPRLRDPEQYKDPVYDITGEPIKIHRAIFTEDDEHTYPDTTCKLNVDLSGELNEQHFFSSCDDESSQAMPDASENSAGSRDNQGSRNVEATDTQAQKIENGEDSNLEHKDPDTTCQLNVDHSGELNEQQFFSRCDDETNRDLPDPSEDSAASSDNQGSRNVEATDTQAQKVENGEDSKLDLSDGMQDLPAEGTWKTRDGPSDAVEKVWLLMKSADRKLSKVRKGKKSKDCDLNLFMNAVDFLFPLFDNRTPSPVELAKAQLRCRKRMIPVSITRSIVEVAIALPELEESLALIPFKNPLLELLQSEKSSARKEALVLRILAVKEAEARRDVIIYSAANSMEGEGMEVDMFGKSDVLTKQETLSDVSDEGKWWEAADKLGRMMVRSKQADDFIITARTDNLGTHSCDNAASGESRDEPLSLEEQIASFWSTRDEKKQERKPVSRYARSRLPSVNVTSYSMSENENSFLSESSSIYSIRSGSLHAELEIWAQKHDMASWPKAAKSGWISKNKSPVRAPKPIHAVSTTVRFRYPSFIRNRHNPPSSQWKLPYSTRVKSHVGYFDVDVQSLYQSATVKRRVHPFDGIPWESRDVKQRFLHEQSVSYQRNWFGMAKKVYGNTTIKYKVVRPKSMEMPMKAGEWTEEWFRKPWSTPSPSSSFGSAGADLEEIREMRRLYVGVGEDDSLEDNASWEETPECGTFRNIRQRIGERISRVTPEYTSSLRKSRWRKKYFPKGTFPY